MNRFFNLSLYFEDNDREYSPECYELYGNMTVEYYVEFKEVGVSMLDVLHVYQ